LNDTKDILEGTFSYLDKENMIKDLEGISQHIEKALKLGEMYSNSIFADNENVILYKNVKNITFLGMGGSAIGGNLMTGYLADEINVPINVIRGYDIPKYIDKDSMVFAISYSGNTEETFSTLKQSHEKGAKIIILSSGGHFEVFTKQKNIPFIALPSGIQPRVALPFLFFPVLKVLEKIRLIEKRDVEIFEMLQILNKISGEYGFKSEVKSNLAKKIALSLFRHLPLVYGSEGILSAVAMRWKTQINENSKWPSFWNTFAELDHNEIVGYEIENEVNKLVKIVYLEDRNGLLRIKQRASITKNIIRNKVREFITCTSIGENKLSRMFSLIYLGDMVSYYLAILNGINPSPVDCIENLKKELKSN